MKELRSCLRSRTGFLAQTAKRGLTMLCRWLDRLLIRVCSRFGDYQANDPRTFDLQPAMAMFPQFMFNLRRSNFVQVGHTGSLVYTMHWLACRACAYR